MANGKSGSAAVVSLVEVKGIQVVCRFLSEEFEAPEDVRQRAMDVLDICASDLRKGDAVRQLMQGMAGCSG